MKIEILQKKLALKQTTSVQLVREAIIKYQRFLDRNPLVGISPLAMSQAEQADQERKHGFLRGPLHGIPVVIKDNILYQDGTPTTANSYALHRLYPQENASLVKALISAGAIILGKANLSEFAYFMGNEHTPSGYGSMYGQVKHPIADNIDPYGSSTGSAVAVALDIVTLAVGTETNGSIMAPAYQCQVVGFKPTTGMISRTGIIPISPSQDTAGPLAQSVYDCAVMMDVLSEKDEQDPLTQVIVRPASFLEKVQRPFKRARIGALQLKGVELDQLKTKLMEDTKTKLLASGHEVVDLMIDLPPLDNMSTLRYEFKFAINDFLKRYAPLDCPQSLNDIIQFNHNHSERCLRYGQETLLKSNELTLNDQSEYQRLRHQLLQEAQQLEALLIAHELDFVFAPLWLGFAPIYGNPSLCLPSGYVEGQPLALVFVGRRGHDAELLHFGYHYYDARLAKE